MSTSEDRAHMPTPEQARSQLNEAATRERPSRRDTTIGAAGTLVLSFVIAATLAAVTLWRGNAALLAMSMGVYGVAVAVLMVWMGRRRVVDRRWVRRYVWGFGGTMLLYMVGILWQSTAFPGWAIFAPFCVLVAAPGVVAAVKMMKA